MITTRFFFFCGIIGEGAKVAVCWGAVDVTMGLTLVSSLGTARAGEGLAAMVDCDCGLFGDFGDIG